MKIISWNVNGIRAAYKKGFLQFVESQNADIICVQETKARIEQVSEDLLKPLGMTSHWTSAEKAGYSGVATFLKNPISRVEHGIGMPDYDREGRFVVTYHGDFILFNVYFPNGARSKERHDYKQTFLRDFKSHLKKLLDAGEKIIVLGDYNIAPLPKDIYDPVKHALTSGFLEEERNWFQEFLNAGFVDTFRKFHPDVEHRYTWWNQMERARLGNRGWRIDMICVSKNLEPHLVSADIYDQIEGSDHCPIVVEMKDLNR